MQQRSKTNKSSPIKPMDPYQALVHALSGQKPQYTPPPPTRRMRGWGGKSILED